MAKGYAYHKDDDEEGGGGPPSRPIRRRDSHREGERNYGYSSEYAYGHHQRQQQQQQHKTSSYTGGHYAESPIQVPSGTPRTLEIVRDDRPASSRLVRPTLSSEGLDRHHGGGVAHSHHTASRRSSTLPGGGGGAGGSASGSRLPRSSSRPSRLGGATTVSKVTRSRSLSSRPAGISVYHPHGHTTPTHETYPVAVHSAPGSRPGTRMSSKSGRSHATTTGTGIGKNSTQAGVVVETMSAPNPFCPNTRGVCCLMVLVNLALILVCIGFIIVLQLYEPRFVWNIGIVITVFGFVTFLVAMVYCMCICQESVFRRPGQARPGELYWTHHWQKNITIPEIKTKGKEKFEDEDHFPEDNELSDSSSRDYPQLYLESDYGQRTDREAEFDDTEHEGGGGGHHPPPSSVGKSGKKYTSASSPAVARKDFAASSDRGRH